jgi:hypothetical protein
MNVRALHSASGCGGRRRGYAAFLAMVFLALCSTLSVGFYEQTTTTSTQMPDNDRSIAEAMLAGESGTSFVQYQLSRITIPATTTRDQILPTVAGALSSNLNGTRNMGTMTVGYVSGGSSIAIPSVASQYIPLNDGQGSGFRADVTLGRWQ